MKLPVLCAVVLLPLCALACDDKPASNSVRSPEATAHRTSTPADAVPPAPAEFNAYPQAVADYLTAHPEAATGLACLYELFDAWDMPYFSGERSCRAGNTDNDADAEVAVVLIDPTEADPAPLYSEISLFDRDDTTYRVAYTSGLTALGRDQTNLLGNVILAMRDVNGDGGGELVYAAPWCGAHTCGVSVHILSGTDAGYRALTPQDGYTIETPRRVELVDVDGDGADELILSGGAIYSAVSGPGILRVDTYAWNEKEYILHSSIPD